MKKMAEKAPFMIAHEFQAVHRCGPVLTMDSSRVILKRYMPSQRAIAIRVIKQVLALKEAVVRQSLEDVLNNYADRHRPAFVKNFARMRFHELRGLLTTPPPPRAAQEARETQVAGVPASEKSPVAAFAQAAIEERLIRRGARLSDNDENSIPNEDIVLPKNLAVRPQDKTNYPPPSTGEVTKGTGTVAAPSPAMSLSSSDSQRRAEEKPLSARAREEELARLNDEVMSPVDFGLCDAAHSEAGVCPRPLSEARKLLIGVYFLHEYSIESAALFNPSVVPHWDQTGVPEGSLRFILSMRATGEGHISSIEFRTGIFHPFVKPQGRIQMDLPRKPIMAALLDHTFTGEEEAAARGKIDAARQELRARRTLPFLSPCAGGGGLSVETHALSPGGSSASGGLNPETHPLLSPVASTAAAEAARYHTSELTTPGVSHHQLQNPRNPDCFRVVAPQDMGVDQRVIFPVTPSQSNGLEDARFVLFCDDDGSARYYATFTAYDGRAIEPQLLETTDFCSFIFRRLRGDIFNKGMALFPRKIQGKYWMLSRQDDENVLVMSSDDILEWKDPTVIARPEQIWEMFKMGNCGSPIETDQGWIVLTHGVGPLRAYGIGAILLDLNDPTKVIGRLKEPIVAPNEFEREGYVPNAVYTCGAMAYGGMLLVPYATSDTTSSFATVRLEVLVGALLKSGPGGEPPVLSQRATTITSQH